MPPRVLSTIPASDSVRVGTDTVIEVEFNESMDRRSVERSIFIAPRQGGGLSLKWKGRRLQIRQSEPLMPDRTYRVTIGAESKDEYRNRMIGSYDFVFSTGETVHRGAISGRVREGKGRTVYVGAFDLEIESDPHPSDLAPYVTLIGDTGSYSFPGLAPSTYRVFAFEDADDDQVYDSGVERLAVPPEDVTLDSAWVLPDLVLANRDTVSPRPVTARAIDARRIRLKFDEAIGSAPDVSISDGLVVETTHVDGADSSVVYAVTSPQAEGNTYRIEVTAVEDAHGNEAAADTVLTVKGDGRVDTRGPSVVRTRPRDGATVVSATPIVLTFDEAMHPDAAPAWVATDSTVAPPGSWQWTRPNELQFAPDELPVGELSLRLESRTIVDRAGNALKPVVDLMLEVVEERDLGTVFGTTEPSSDTVVMSLYPGAGGDVLETVVAAGDTMFTVERLLPGPYRVTGFVDLDRDGAWFPGRARPFRPSEPVLGRVDTVDARARWETGIEEPFKIPTTVRR